MAYDFSSLKNSYKQVLELVNEDMKMIKTGRARPAMVEDVMVEAYGTKMPIKELASITAPDPHMIVIAPWDQGVVEGIEKALSTGKQQFNPSVDGQQIRIKIPALTGEVREQMVKSVKQHVESGRQMLRSARTDEKKQIEEQEGQSGVSEDDIKKDLDDLEKITSEYIERLEKMGEEKEEELMTI